MKRILLLASLVTVAFLLSAPASATTPSGKGLSEPFPVTCEGLGSIMVVETRGGGATAWSTTGLHVVLKSFTVEVEGQVVFSKSFGTKAGFTTFTCTATEEDEGTTFNVTAVVALVPPS